MLRLKFLLGLLDPYVDVNRAEAVARWSEHLQLALDAARQSIVLLKMIKTSCHCRKTHDTVAMINPNSDTSGHNLVIVPCPPFGRSNDHSVHHSCHCAGGDRGSLHQWLRNSQPSKNDFYKAIEVAKKSDVIIAVVGGNSKTEYVEEEGAIIGGRTTNAECGEGMDRATLELVADRIKLRILVDRVSFEIFGNNGIVSPITYFSPEPNAETLVIFAEEGCCKAVELKAYELRSIWVG